MWLVDIILNRITKGTYEISTHHNMCTLLIRTVIIKTKKFKILR